MFDSRRTHVRTRNTANPFALIRARYTEGPVTAIPHTRNTEGPVTAIPYYTTCTKNPFIFVHSAYCNFRYELLYFSSKVNQYLTEQPIIPFRKIRNNGSTYHTCTFQLTYTRYHYAQTHVREHLFTCSTSRTFGSRTQH